VNVLHKVRGLLGQPFFYNFLQNAVGVPQQREFLVRQFVRPQKGDRILDIGCGTADILAHLKPFEISYTGIEPNEAYVKYAVDRWGSEGRYEFRVAAIGKNAAPAITAREYDIAIAFGVMHHLPDEDVCELLKFAAGGLRQGGRLVTMDPCRLPDMNVLEKLLVKYDRGCYIREVSGYATLVKSAFHSVKYVVKAMTNLPARPVVFECGAPFTESTAPANTN
jgi:SAM-dependent methyltransferase